ncbi:MAG TPA: nucleotidyltransferase family protein, partial [Dehalococcoidia bacterium]|nr:nucleotidyltransferase family protein [Dehalococcoidia bacterium]
MSQEQGVKGELSGTERERALRFILLALWSRKRSKLRESLCHALEGPLDWPHLLKEAQSQGVAPLLDEALGSLCLEGLVPPSVKLELRNVRAVVLHRNLILLSELRRVLDHFRTVGVEGIALKGPVLAETLYGDISLRPARDIDLLVKPADMPVCRWALASLGYGSLNRRKERHAFHDPPYFLAGPPRLCLELHWGMSDERLVPLDSKAMWERAGYALVDGARVLTLSPEDNLLFLAYHLTKHWDMPLRRLCDIGQLLEKHETSLNWSYIIQALHGTGTKGLVYSSVARAHRLLGAPVPPTFLESIAPGAAWRFLLGRVASDRAFLGLSKRLGPERVGLAHCLMHTGMRRGG